MLRTLVRFDDQVDVGEDDLIDKGVVKVTKKHSKTYKNILVSTVIRIRRPKRRSSSARIGEMKVTKLTKMALSISEID